MRIERSEVVEEDLVLCGIRVLEIDGFDFDQSEVSFTVLRRSDLPRDCVPRSQVKLANLRRRDLNIVRPRQVVVVRSAEKAEPFRQAFEYAF